MGHPQPTMPLQVDKICTNGIINGTTKQVLYKAIGMRLHWLKDCEYQGQFHVHWSRGTDKIANYFTNNHSQLHYNCMRYIYLLHLHCHDLEL